MMNKKEKAFHEVYHNIPSTVKKAKVSGKRKREMMIAIALSKSKSTKAR